METFSLLLIIFLSVSFPVAYILYVTHLLEKGKISKKNSNWLMCILAILPIIIGPIFIGFNDAGLIFVVVYLILLGISLLLGLIFKYLSSKF